MRRFVTCLLAIGVTGVGACAQADVDSGLLGSVDASVNDRALPPGDSPVGTDVVQPPDDALQPPEDAPPPPGDVTKDAAPFPDLAGCADGLTACMDSCRDLARDPRNCGACDRACASGQTCLAGMCSCPIRQMLCGSACIDTSGDPMNCGACSRACPSGQSCSDGNCTLVCPAGQTNCGGACRALPTDPLNCGGCGRVCPAGNQCVSNACVAGSPRGPEFRLQWLGSTNCRSSEHATLTGADRGGIALANSQVFYTGQTATGRFNAASLQGASTGARYDSLVSNLRTGVVFTFVDALGMPLTSPGAVATALRELDGSTGALTTRSLALSSPIPIMGPPTGSTVGFFSGWDRLLVLANGRAYNIDLPSGAVLDLGLSPLPTRNVCNGWAFGGVAEMASGIAYITYASDPTTVSRRPLPMGPATPVSQFVSISNMCGFTIAPGAQRWYFHHSRSSQLGGGTGSMETIGYCDASTTVAGPLCPPANTSCGGICRNLNIDASNCGTCGVVCPTGQSCAAGRCMGAPLRYARSAPPVSVSFIDACVAPGHTTVLTNVDDAIATASMPFDFRYWGVPVVTGTTLTISSNGYLVIGPTTATPLSGSIPLAAMPNNVVAPQWRDLRTQGDGVCIVTAGAPPARRFAVHWSNLANYPSGGQLNFEAVFNEADLSIDLLYTTMTGATTGTAGLENGTGTDAIGACPMGSTVTSCVVPASTRWRFSPAP